MSGLCTKLEVPHRDDCSAMGAVRRGIWSSPWFMPLGWGDEPNKTVRRDSVGRKNPNAWQKWLVLRCNSVVDTPCPAVMLVSEDSLLRLVPHE